MVSRRSTLLPSNARTLLVSRPVWILETARIGPDRLDFGIPALLLPTYSDPVAPTRQAIRCKKRPRIRLLTFEIKRSLPAKLPVRSRTVHNRSADPDAHRFENGSMPF